LCCSFADESEVKFLSQYLAELSLLDAQTYLHFVPSVIGAASVALARHTLGLAAWDSGMVEKTGLRVDDFKECLICLHESFANAHEYPQQAIREKYKNEK
jgi:cyclin A